MTTGEQNEEEKMESDKLKEEKENDNNWLSFFKRKM